MNTANLEPVHDLVALQRSGYIEAAHSTWYAYSRVSLTAGPDVTMGLLLIEVP